MRHYPTDSREATARIVALALLADGAIDLSEAETMQRHEITAKLGLDAQLLDRVVHAFCEDLLSSAHCTSAGQHELDPATIDALLGEIRSPALRMRLFSAILNIINAEGEVLSSEVLLLARALKVWSLDAGTASLAVASSPAAVTSSPASATRAQKLPTPEYAPL